MEILNNTTPLFKIRASALGQLMTEPRGKKEKEDGELSATAKSYLTLWYKEQLYNRRKPIESKYMTKGNECEDEAIKYLHKSWKNNKEQFENDYMTGEPDVITKGEIIDIKNSWDFTTFPLFSKECPSKEYIWQVRSYMELCGKKKGRVIYTLMDTPDHLIPQGDDPAIYKYNGLARHLRVKEFKVAYDEEKIEQIIAKVKKAREFVNCISL